MSNTAAIWAKLNKELGGDVLFRASEALKLNWEVVDYPCTSLGSAVGVWGVPLNGKITQFHGPENCGKTFLAMLMAKEVLDKYPKSEVVWADAELSFNKDWASKLGLDISRVVILNTNNAVEIFTTLCGKFNDKGKKVVPGVLDLVVAGQLDVKLIVLDSIAQLVPPSEEGRKLEDFEMAALARFLPKALRQLKPMLAKANAGMICINQLRESMTPGAQPSYSGGRAYRYNLDFAIKLHPSTKEENILRDAKGDKLGHMIIATVEKSRGGINKHQAEFFLDFTKGVVRQGEELAKLGAAYGVIERPNLQNWKYGDKTVRGKENFYALLEENPALRKEILEKIKERKAAGIEISLDLSDEAASEATKPSDFGDDGEEPSDE